MRFFFGLANDFMEIFALQIAKNYMANRAFQELNQLSAKELADLGLNKATMPLAIMKIYL